MADTLAAKLRDLRDLGNAAYRAGNFKAAVARYDEGVGQLPEEAGSADVETERRLLLSNACAARLRSGDAEAALVVAEKLMKVAPEWPKTFCRMAAVMHAMQLFKEACAIARKGMAKVDEQERAALAKHTDDEESKKVAASAIAEASAANEMLSRAVQAGQKKIVGTTVDVNDFSALEALEGDDQDDKSAGAGAAAAAGAGAAPAGTTDVNALFSEVDKEAAGAKAKRQNFVAKGERTVDDSEC